MRKALILPDFQREVLPFLTEEDMRVLIVNTRGYDTWGGLITQGDMVGLMRLALPPLLKRRPCSWTWGLYVTWEGQVRACSCRFQKTESNDGKDSLYLGNLNDHTLSEIWLGKNLKKLRRRFEQGNLPLVCKNCTVYRPC